MIFSIFLFKIWAVPNSIIYCYLVQPHINLLQQTIDGQMVASGVSEQQRKTVLNETAFVITSGDIWGLIEGLFTGDIASAGRVEYGIGITMPRGRNGRLGQAWANIRLDASDATNVLAKGRFGYETAPLFRGETLGGYGKQTIRTGTGVLTNFHAENGNVVYKDIDGVSEVLPPALASIVAGISETLGKGELVEELHNVDSISLQDFLGITSLNFRDAIEDSISNLPDGFESTVANILTSEEGQAVANFVLDNAGLTSTAVGYVSTANQFKNLVEQTRTATPAARWSAFRRFTRGANWLVLAQVLTMEGSSVDPRADAKAFAEYIFGSIDKSGWSVEQNEFYEENLELYYNLATIGDEKGNYISPQDYLDAMVATITNIEAEIYIDSTGSADEEFLSNYFSMQDILEGFQSFMQPHPSTQLHQDLAKGYTHITLGGNPYGPVTANEIITALLNNGANPTLLFLQMTEIYSAAVSEQRYAANPDTNRENYYGVQSDLDYDKIIANTHLIMSNADPRLNFAAAFFQEIFNSNSDGQFDSPLEEIETLILSQDGDIGAVIDRLYTVDPEKYGTVAESIALRLINMGVDWGAGSIIVQNYIDNLLVERLEQGILFTPDQDKIELIRHSFQPSQTAGTFRISSGPALSNFSSNFIASVPTAGSPTIDANAASIAYDLSQVGVQGLTHDTPSVMDELGVLSQWGTNWSGLAETSPSLTFETVDLVRDQLEASGISVASLFDENGNSEATLIDVGAAGNYTVALPQQAGTNERGYVTQNKTIIIRDDENEITGTLEYNPLTEKMVYVAMTPIDAENDGVFEGREMTFDGADYLAANPDLLVTLGNDPKAATEHYLAYGHAEGRETDFDSLEYLAANTDVLAAYGFDHAAARNHYLTSGFAEGRETNFDELTYLASHGDLITTLGANENDALAHYLLYGINEGRAAGGFDGAEYLTANPDLLAAFGNDVRAATEHYISYGHAEGREI